MRIIIGVFSVIFSVAVFFESIFAGLGNALEQNGQVGGSTGIFLSFIFLASGIIILAAKDSFGAQLTSSILLAVFALIGFVNAGDYEDLYVWSVVGLVFAVLNFFFVTLKLRKNKNKSENK